MERLSHSERAERRKQISLEANELILNMPFDSMVRLLVEKHGLTEAYIRKILPAKMKSRCKELKEEHLIKEILELAGTDKPVNIFKSISNKHGLSCNYVVELCRRHEIKLPSPTNSRKRSQEKEDQVRALIEQGLTVNEISRKLHNSRENIYRYYRRMLDEGRIDAIPATKSLLKKKQVKETIESHSDEIIRLYNNGASVRELATKYGLPFLQLSHFLSASNVVNINSTPAIPETKIKWLAVIADLFNKDLSLSDIARKHNKAHSNVSLFASECKKIGIPLPERIDGRSKRSLFEDSTYVEPSSKIPSEATLNTTEHISVEACVGYVEKFIDSTSTVLVITV